MNRKKRTNTQNTNTGDMTVRAVKRALGYHRDYVYQLVRRGVLPAVKISGQYLVSRAAVEKLRADRARLRQAIANNAGGQ